jgi:hypothetical protein
VVEQVEFVAGGSKFTFSNKEAYDGTAFAARERLVESFNKTMKFMKFVHVLCCTPVIKLTH